MSFIKTSIATLLCASLVAAQSNSPYFDPTSGITYQGYTDPVLDITVGFVLPPLSTPSSDEYIVQIVAPVSNGWTGVSAGGTMADSLLFVLWPYNNQIILGTRWSSGYVLPDMYPGPIITLLPDSTVNSTHIKASFRCQNCTVWEDGSFGSGDLNSFELIGYVAATTTQPADPSNVASSLDEHDDFDFFGLDLTTVHNSSYNSWISGSSATTSSKPASTSTVSSSSHTTSSSSHTTSTSSHTTSTSSHSTTTSTVHSTTTTSSAPAPTQTEYGQCGGIGWTGPTACAAGLVCTQYSSYYYQCTP